MQGLSDLHVGNCYYISPERLEAHVRATEWRARGRTLHRSGGNGTLYLTQDDADLRAVL